jgi:hypothetical protein
MALQGARQVEKLRVSQIGYEPIRHFGSIPVEDLVALRVLVLYRAIGRAGIRRGCAPTEEEGKPAPWCDVISPVASMKAADHKDFPVRHLFPDKAKSPPGVAFNGLRCCEESGE